jgi:hypothetical protein
VIRARLSTNTKPLDDLAEFAGDFARIAADIGEDVYLSIEDDLVDELRYYPPPPPNSSYQRTFKLRDGWEVSYGRDGNGFAIRVENDTSYSKYVVGSLAQARAAAASFQADVHKGRWVLAADTIGFWFEAFLAEYQTRFTAELSKFGTTSTSRRAFTR